MRELSGVTSVFPTYELAGLKQKALLFDKLYLVERETASGLRLLKWSVRAEIDFLISRGLVHPAPPSRMDFEGSRTQAILKKYMQSPAAREINPDAVPGLFLNDFAIRTLTESINSNPPSAVVPICNCSLPEGLDPVDDRPLTQNVFHVALGALPVPGDDISWDDLLDFKAELHDKQWDFRRFLRTLSEKQQTEVEILDDIEWTLNQYAKEMSRLKSKKSVSFMEVYIIPTIEAAESFKPSAFLKGLVSIKKRKIELMDGEANAKGRECAYVFDARKRFGEPDAR